MLKKIAALFIAIASLMSLTVNSFASDVVILDDNFVTEEQLIDSREQAEELVALGSSIRRARVATYTLSVPLIYQDDSRWKNVLIPGSNYTYGDSGCAMTCFAMISRKYGNASETPVTFGNKYYTRYNTSPINFNSVNAAAIMGKSATAYGNNNQTSTENFIVGSIASGAPVIIKFDKGGNDNHFVVAYGYSVQSNSSQDVIDVYIRDPESGFGYTTLRDCARWNIVYMASIG